MKKGLAATHSRYRLTTALLALLALLGSCRTCPIDVCHIRKAHYHNGVKYRARPIWKMQYPSIGERIKVKSEGDGKKRDGDRSKPLK